MISTFEQYDKVTDSTMSERAKIWKTAIGLQAVDQLSVSDYLKTTAKKHIDGDITIEEANKLVKTYYEAKKQRISTENDTEEADKVSINIAKILNEKSFSFSLFGFKSIHKCIFDDVFPSAGKFRDYDIIKKEWVLDGDTVLYSRWQDLEAAVTYDLEQEKRYKYTTDIRTNIEHLANFVSGLWQIHPFCEGNTRTTAVFTIKYLRSLGIEEVNNDMFEQYSWYFRNALVRANYNNFAKGINAENEFLIMFFRNLILRENNVLENRKLKI